MGGFSVGHFGLAGFNSDLIYKFIEQYVNPLLVHTAEQCQWDEKRMTVLTPKEIDEDVGAGDLEEQSWFIDILQMEKDEKKKKKAGGYANEKALYEFNEEHMLKMMHEKNEVLDEGEEEEVASLSSKQNRIKKKKHLKEEKGLNSQEHRLKEKLAEAQWQDLSEEKLKEELDKGDDISKQFMVNAERKCRKFKNGKILFLPEAAVWIQCLHFYCSLLRYWAGKIKNQGNLKRTARQCKIANVFHLTVEEIPQRLDECKSKCKYYEMHGQWYRTQHLKKRLEVAQLNEDAVAEQRILEIIQQEKDSAFWRRLNWALGKER
ncbi:hypothetical protein ACHAW6_015486, partial [Cyclotella cf. meneghiniana]